MSVSAHPHLVFLGGSERIREEMTGNRTMERSCQLPAIAWSLLPLAGALKAVSQASRLAKKKKSTNINGKASERGKSQGLIQLM